MSENNALPTTLQQAVKYFDNSRNCIQFVAAMRWADGVAVCPKCKGTNAHFMESRKVWQCKNKECKKQFSVKVGTIFEDSALGLDKWLIAMWLLVNAKNGISSYELSRALGITQKSAWFVLHRIRTAMHEGTIEKLSGTIEADETFIGGDAKNMHKARRDSFQMTHGRRDHKTAVLGMIERKGRVRAKVVPAAQGKYLVPEIRENVEAGSNLMTDGATAYEKLASDYVHEAVNHAVEYVRGTVHTNNIENFWSLLKRSIRGTYVSVEAAHLQAYVEEQAFRFNTRKGTDRTRFLEVVQAVSGKRLTYEQLIGRRPLGN